MRKFSSFGSINTKLHYYVPRQALIDQAATHLTGALYQPFTKLDQILATGVAVEPVLVTTVE